MKKIITNIDWDWKSYPSKDDLIKALEPFGIYVYDDLSLEYSDTYFQISH